MESQNQNTRHSVTLLWSGGWDGTFRLLQLCQNDITIQPVYVTDSDRSSTEIEKQRIDEILKICRERFPAEIRDVTFYDKNWILETCKDEQISSSFRHLRKTYNLGSQYEWFALLTRYLDQKMECGVVHQYHGKVEEAIDHEGTMELIQGDILPGRYHVLPKEDQTSAYDVFGNLIFPIIRLTKKDEENIARDNGWMDIMNLSWFCHTPIHGEPCGVCGPCEDAMNTGMEWRLPAAAKRRYKYRKLIRFCKRIKNRILRTRKTV